MRECHELVLGKETVRSLMTAAGLWKPRRQRAAPIHQPRNRRACLGELIQINGSDKAWFEGRAPGCTLVVFIDDETGQLTPLHFTPSESTFTYFQATRAYPERHGIRPSSAVHRGRVEGSQRAITADAIYKLARAYSKALGFEIGAHSLQATAATNALDHHADSAEVQEWLGHAKIATTRIYHHRKTRAEDSPTFKVAY